MSRTLAILALAAALGGCATKYDANIAGAPPPPPTPQLEASTGASPYGLFLAGQAARDSGHLGAAAYFLGRASAAEGEPAFLKASAFTAALQAGDIAAAASLAPDASDPPGQQLGALVRGVEAMAEGDDKAAQGLLVGADGEAPVKDARLLVAPFAAAAAGDAAKALAPPTIEDDPLAQVVSELDRAMIAERLGRRSQAEATLKALVDAGEAANLSTRAYGGFLERRGRWADAVTLYRKRLADAPDDGGAAVALARAQARGHAPTLPTFNQGAAQALMICAAGLSAEKQDASALSFLRLSLRLDPASDEAWLLVGELLSRADVDGARAAFASVAPGSENYAAARAKLAWSYQNAGDHETALKLARETLTAAPGDRGAATTLADLLRGDDQNAEAVQVLTRLIEAPGAPADWRLYYARASAYEALGDVDKTEADLAEALKLDPDEPELLNFQGYFWIDRGEHLKEALSMVQRAAAAEPGSGEVIDSLGWAYYRLGDYPTAVAKLEQAVTLDAGIAEVNDHLGDAYWRVGRKTEAVFQWKRVLTLSPDARLKARVEAKIASPLGPDAPPIATPKLATP